MEGKEISNKNVFPKELFSVGEKYSKKDIMFISNKKIYTSSGVVPCDLCIQAYFYVPFSFLNM